eukprot:7097185-Prymnesium_polylepis.1
MHGLEPILQRGQLILERKELIREIQPQHRNRSLHRITMVHYACKMFTGTDDVAFGARPESEIGR